MKKVFATLIATATLACAAFGFAACGESYDADHIITVGASQTPHAEILEEIKGDLKKQGYKLNIKVFDDYITPNTALDDGSLDANYFQHTPYLNTFNAEHNTHLVAVDKIHYEPFGVYGRNVTKEEYEATKTGRTILIPNDGSNLARALYLLQDEGYITLKSTEFTESLTTEDIEDSKGNTVVDVEAQTVAAQLRESKDGTIAVINGNYALQANLKATDALAFEDASGQAAQTYANIIAVKEGNENLEKIRVLIRALKTQKVIDFINEEYDGAVQAVFTV